MYHIENLKQIIKITIYNTSPYGKKIYLYQHTALLLGYIFSYLRPHILTFPISSSKTSSLTVGSFLFFPLILNWNNNYKNRGFVELSHSTRFNTCVLNVCYGATAAFVIFSRGVSKKWEKLWILVFWMIIYIRCFICLIVNWF